MNKLVPETRFIAYRKNAYTSIVSFSFLYSMTTRFSLFLISTSQRDRLFFGRNQAGISTSFRLTISTEFAGIEYNQRSFCEISFGFLNLDIRCVGGV